MKIEKPGENNKKVEPSNHWDRKGYGIQKESMTESDHIIIIIIISRRSILTFKLKSRLCTKTN